MLKIGDKVQCRMFNTPEKRFYGEIKTGTIVAITSHASDKAYSIAWDNVPLTFDVQRKEILRRVK